MRSKLLNTASSLGTLLLLSMSATPVFAQQDTIYVQSDAVEGQKKRARINDDSFSTAHDKAMGGFAGSFSQGIDALYANPATTFKNVDALPPRGFIKQLHFPYVGASFNQNSRELASSMGKGFVGTPAIYSEAIEEAANGNDQYARISFVPNVMFGSLLIAPIYDQQLAAVKLNETSDDVEMLYQARSGIAGSFSMHDTSETLFLGISASHSSLKRQEGTFTADQVATLDQQKELFKDSALQYSGMDLQAGMLWRIAKKASPVISLTGNHIGETTYKPKDSANDPLIEKERYHLGFGVSPSPLSWLHLGFGAGMADISNHEMEWSDKWRTSAEAKFGPVASFPIGGVRLGGNSNGASFGGNVNLGFIGVQYANYPEDIGVGNKRVIERRDSAAISIDLAVP